MKNINVAVIGIGSFAKALVEGVSYYTKYPDECIGLISPVIGRYRVKDINFVAAFDVDERKIGHRLHEAIYAGANVTRRITEPLKYNALVHRGPTLDGIANELRGNFIRESNEPSINVTEVLRESKADVAVNLIPTGSEQATRMYAEAALRAGCSFINCIPTSLITTGDWKRRFVEKGIVLLGDDIKSQLGATMLNRMLLSFLKERGIRVTKSEQENHGGNADHFNLLHRSASKEKSKREALSQFLEPGEMHPDVRFFYTGSSSGHKTVKIRIDGEMFGRTPISISSRIEDEISVNGAGTLVDAIRVAQLLVDGKRQDQVDVICPFLFKSPPRNVSDAQSYEDFRKIIFES